MLRYQSTDRQKGIDLREISLYPKKGARNVECYRANFQQLINIMTQSALFLQDLYLYRQPVNIFREMDNSPTSLRKNLWGNIAKK